MLDKLPAWARHLLLMLFAAVLTWAGTDLVPALDGKPGLAGLVGVLLVTFIAFVTPLTRQYGVGS